MVDLHDNEVLIAEAVVSSKTTGRKIGIGAIMIAIGILGLIGSFAIKGHNSINKFDAGTILLFMSLAVLIIGFLAIILTFTNKNKTGLAVTNMRVVGSTVGSTNTNVTYIDENIKKITNVVFEKTQADEAYGCATVVITVSSGVYKFSGIQNYQEIVNAIKKQMK